MKNLYEVKFEYFHMRKLGYFEIADLEDLCELKTRTNFIMAQTPQQAESIIKHNYGETTKIIETTRLQQEKEMTR